MWESLQIKNFDQNWKVLKIDFVKWNFGNFISRNGNLKSIEIFFKVLQNRILISFEKEFEKYILKVGISRSFNNGILKSFEM